MNGIIALDFDGVLHSYTSGWTGPVPIDPPLLNAQAFCKELIRRGFEVVVFTTRAETLVGLNGTVTWLGKHKFPSMRVMNKKPAAKLYVDDRGFRFEGVFHTVLEFLDANPTLEPWNR